MLHWIPTVSCPLIGQAVSMRLQTNPWWHQMETFSVLLASCAGNSPITGEFPQWCRALIVSLICAWINSWVNNREACDLRRHHDHYDISVMQWLNWTKICWGNSLLASPGLINIWLPSPQFPPYYFLALIGRAVSVHFQTNCLSDRAEIL